MKLQSKVPEGSKYHFELARFRVIGVRVKGVKITVNI